MYTSDRNTIFKSDVNAKLFCQDLDNDPYFAILTLSIYFFGVELLE
jgi:hypothetical protein